VEPVRGSWGELMDMDERFAKVKIRAGDHRARCSPHRSRRSTPPPRPSPDKDLKDLKGTRRPPQTRNNLLRLRALSNASPQPKVHRLKPNTRNALLVGARGGRRRLPLFQSRLVSGGSSRRPSSAFGRSFTPLPIMDSGWALSASASRSPRSCAPSSACGPRSTGASDGKIKCPEYVREGGGELRPQSRASISAAECASSIPSEVEEAIRDKRDHFADEMRQVARDRVPAPLRRRPW